MILKILESAACSKARLYNQPMPESRSQALDKADHEVTLRSILKDSKYLKISQGRLESRGFRSPFGLARPSG